MKEKEQNDKFQLLKHAIENIMPGNKILGLKIVDMQEGYVFIHIPFKEEFIGDFLQGRWHGGILATIADTAGGIAGATTLHSDKDRLNTVDMRIDYLHAAIKTDIYAKARIIKNGKTIIKVDVALFQNEKEEPVALARCVYSVQRNEM
ncbi:MAG: PaaI family thioesterase [Flavobacterium lindanitolerans]|uniref:PaaI family thioesterase n=1 Tax=Flavobacterium lindanitolerans TaxID=428988 RepID=UPI001A585012|nr:PaaI family thioesterase [Flavobacterium lindanitolerans]MBL7869950.1 PaaI family thioesterase [Flavobacterium lindanitolerans]